MDAPRIWKYEVPVGDEIRLHMPRGAQILTVQMQGSTPCIWAKVDAAPEHSQVWRVFRWRGTGHDADNTDNYVGTVQMMGGGLVFHLFVDRE